MFYHCGDRKQLWANCDALARMPRQDYNGRRQKTQINSGSICEEKKISNKLRYLDS